MKIFSFFLAIFILAIVFILSYFIGLLILQKSEKFEQMNKYVRVVVATFLGLVILYFIKRLFSGFHTYDPELDFINGLIGIS